MLEISEEEFEEKYKPVQNTVTEGSAFDGRMFETYGEDLKHIQEHDKAHVWTIIDGENESLWYSAGMHFVNRLGYLITENPHTFNEEVKAWSSEED